MTSLTETCAPLKEHLLHLFGKGEKALSQLIVNEYPNVHPDLMFITLERITFSREFVAVDFNYKGIRQGTVYIAIEEVEKHCY